MLKICTSFSELDFDRLCRVYGYDDADSYHKRMEFYDYLREDFFSIRDVFYAVWVVKGEYVSALRIEPFEDGYLLEALQTEKTNRRKGYAKRLIDAVLQNGYVQPVYAHIYKDNKVSLAVHRACGFERYLDHAIFIDGTVSANAYTVKWIK